MATDRIPQAAPDRRIRSRVVVALFAVALASVWLVPGSAIKENRLLREFPVVEGPTIASGEAFRAIDGALDDHLPLKWRVIARVGSTLVGAGLTPAGAVFRGPGGEPFYTDDFNVACGRENEIPGLLEDVDSLAKRWAADGTELIYAIAPDKSSIEDMGPLAPALLACSDRVRQRIEDAATRTGALLLGWDEFAARTAAGERLYIYGDSHWNWSGAAVFSQLVVDRLEPGLFDASSLKGGDPVQHADDLFSLMGVERIEPLEPLTTVRPGVTTVRESENVNGAVVQHWSSQSAGAGLISGRTLLIGDSYSEYNSSILAPYFEDFTAVPFAFVDTPGSVLPGDGFDRVIIQQVQRSAFLVLDKVEAADWMPR